MDRAARLVRLAAGGISTIPPFADKHPEEALPHARQALVSAGVISADAKVAGFLKGAGLCGSCGRDKELRFGTCFDCADSVKMRHLGDGVFSARNTKSGKTYLAKFHGDALQECKSCGKPKKVKDGICSSCSFFAGKRKKVASKRTPLPRCVKCGGPGGQYPTAVCKKCGYDGKPVERRRSKQAGLARRFRLNLAVQKATERGHVPAALHAANEMASMKVQRRVTNVMGKGLDAYMSYAGSRGVQHDMLRQSALRGRHLAHAGVDEFPGHMQMGGASKIASFWRPRSSFPYRGDLKVIALNPESGITESARETILDEHYRRMSAARRPNLGEAAVLGAARGATFGAAVTGLRAAAGFRSGGMTLADALRHSLGPATVGGGIGAALGIPAGIWKGFLRNREITQAQQYTGSDLATRRAWVRAEVNHALGVS